jgi:hypothetical protein
MNQVPRWVLLMKKKGGGKSRTTVPLNYLKSNQLKQISPEVGKVTLKSNSDEALNNDFPLKVTAMKHLTLSKNL